MSDDSQNEYSESYDPFNDIRSNGSNDTPIEPPKKSALKQPSSKFPVAKGKCKKKKEIAIGFDGDIEEQCLYCKKKFKNKENLSLHFDGDTKCALNNKLEVYRKNFEKLKANSLDELEEKEEKIKELNAKLINNNTSNTHQSLLGLSEQVENNLKNKLTEFIWPQKRIDDVHIHRYESICENIDEAFSLFFKNMIENPKVSKNKKGKKMGIFIKNEYDQVGLAIKCDGQILLDTTGIIMTLINKFYFQPHKIKIKGGIVR
jgi:hypothetical protein